MRSEFSPGNLLEHIDFQVTLGHQLLQACVFPLEIAQALHVRAFQFTISLPSSVQRLFADTVRLRDLRHGPGIGFAQNARPLFLSETTLPQGLLARQQKPSSQVSNDPQIRGQITLTASIASGS